MILRLAGEVLEVDSEYRKPLDLVRRLLLHVLLPFPYRQYARERWNLQLEALSSG